MFKKRRKKEICLLDDDWVLGKNENRRGAVKPRPLCTPLGLFLGVLGLWCGVRCWLLSVCFGIGCGTLCRGRLPWNCNEVLDVRCTSAEFCSPCGVQQGAAAYAAYAARSPQSILCNNIYPIEIYKVPFDTFRLSVELPIQKHTDTS